MIKKKSIERLFIGESKRKKYDKGRVEDIKLLSVGKFFKIVVFNFRVLIFFINAISFSKGVCDYII